MMAQARKPAMAAAVASRLEARSKCQDLVRTAARKEGRPFFGRGGPGVKSGIRYGKAQHRCIKCKHIARRHSTVSLSTAQHKYSASKHVARRQQHSTAQYSAST